MFIPGSVKEGVFGRAAGIANGGSIAPGRRARQEIARQPRRRGAAATPAATKPARPLLAVVSNEATQEQLELAAKQGRAALAALDWLLRAAPAVTGRECRGGRLLAAVFQSHLGVGRGLTSTSDDGVVKSMLTYEFNAIRPTALFPRHEPVP